MKLAVAELDSADPILGDVVSVVKSLGIVLVGTAAALSAFGIYAMKSAGDLEAMVLGLTAYAGSAEKAQQEVTRLQQVARLPGLGFREAIQGSARLQAVGFDARLAERALLGFGNALALVGGGKDDLDGVILGLSQIISKGTVSAEEINQIAERVPQIRQIMKTAFGTADTEAISKRVTPQQFISKIIDALETLPKATEGAKNAFENFGDLFDRVVTQIGRALNTVLLPAFNQLAGFFDYLENAQFFGNLTSNMLSASNVGRGLVGIFGEIDKFGQSTGLRGLSDIAKNLAGATGLGDGLVRAASVIAATIEAIPSVIRVAMDLVTENAQQIMKLINGIVQAINAVMKTAAGGIDIDLGWFFGKGKIGGDSSLSFTPIPLIQNGFTGSPKVQSEANDVLSGIAKRSKDLYDGYVGYSPVNDVANDPSRGGFTQPDALSQIAANTAATAANTQKANDIQRSILGGGSMGAAAASPVNLTKALSGSGVAGEIQRASEEFGKKIAQIVQGTVLDSHNLNARLGYGRR
jgi:tape measure domain-containing protein